MCYCIRFMVYFGVWQLLDTKGASLVNTLHQCNHPPLCNIVLFLMQHHNFELHNQTNTSCFLASDMAQLWYYFHQSHLAGPVCICNALCLMVVANPQAGHFHYNCHSLELAILLLALHLHPHPPHLALHSFNFWTHMTLPPARHTHDHHSQCFDQQHLSCWS